MFALSAAAVVAMNELREKSDFSNAALPASIMDARMQVSTDSPEKCRNLTAENWRNWKKFNWRARSLFHVRRVEPARFTVHL